MTRALSRFVNGLRAVLFVELKTPKHMFANILYCIKKSFLFQIGPHNLLDERRTNRKLLKRNQNTENNLWVIHATDKSWRN